MEKRREELTKLKTYIKGVDNQLTMILEALQWDRKQLLQSPALVTCKYDSNHKVPPDKIQEHEKECFLRQNGYSKDDQLLPDPLDLESKTLVKLKKEEIEQIIAKASISDILLKKGVGCRQAEPLSLERLQISYSADERRAIHDAVVSAVPSCHDLTDLALLSGGDDKSLQVILSRQEILLQLRNMRRRRAKYRVAAKSRNYSDVLRDVIKTQMEHYVDGKTEADTKETEEKNNNPKDTFNDRKKIRSASKDDRYKYDGKIVPKPIQIKTEREDSIERKYRDNNQRDYSRNRSQIKYERVDSTQRKYKDNNPRDFNRDRSDRYETKSRNTRDRDDRCELNARSTERRHYDELERTQKYGEHSRKKKHDNEARERRNYLEESEDRRQVNEPDKVYSSEKRSSKSHRHKDYDSEYQVYIDLDGLDDKIKNRHRETLKESRREESRDKPHKHKEKEDRRRDRESSKERRRDKRYEDKRKSSERNHFKHEGEGSVTRDGTDAYDNHKDKSRKRKDKIHDGSYRDDKRCPGHSLIIKQEQYDRYYEVPSEITYDPNKKIKVEQ